MESGGASPLLILRSNNKSFKSKQRTMDRRIKRKKYLREEIYSNNNIFHSNVNLYRNMTAQNLIWDKNYNFKCIINQAKEENSSLKAHIWNIEKENRKMDRQIEAWNLTEYAGPNPNKQPFVDAATVEAVLRDQDYQIVSMKMEIFQLERVLAQKDQQMHRLTARNRDIADIVRLLNNQIAIKKVQIYQCVQKKENKKKLESQGRENLAREMATQNIQLDLMNKNIEVKKKSKIALENELAAVCAEIQEHREISEVQIDKLKEQIRRMRKQQDGGAKLANQSLKKAQKNTLEFQCKMQQTMNNYIQSKIPLQLQIDQLNETLQGCDSNLKDSIVLS